MLLVILCHVRYFELRIRSEKPVEIIFINILLMINIEIRHAQDTTIRKV